MLFGNAIFKLVNDFKWRFVAERPDNVVENVKRDALGTDLRNA
nr:hypothetical protein [uncultured Allomuricauda sp.]